MKSTAPLTTSQATRLTAFALALTTILGMPVSAKSVDSRNDNASERVMNHSAAARPAARPAAPARTNMARTNMARPAQSTARAGAYASSSRVSARSSASASRSSAASRPTASRSVASRPNTARPTPPVPTPAGRVPRDPTPPPICLGPMQDARAPLVKITAPSRTAVNMQHAPDPAPCYTEAGPSSKTLPSTAATLKICMAVAKFLRAVSRPASAANISFT